MTATAPAPGFTASPRARHAGVVIGRWGGALGVALVIFSLLLLVKGANPVTTYRDMWQLTFTQSLSVQQIFIQMAPLVLGALAVAVPARAGLTNVGGEGQIIIGAVAACGTYLFLGDGASGGLVLVAMVLASIVAGAVWAGIAAAMRLLAGVNEAISTLLLNFVAVDLLLFLIYQPWRESPVGQPTTKELSDVAKLPVVTGTQVHVGIIIAVVLAVATHLVLKHTRWGFKISVAGGNSEAARRAGLNVSLLVLSALMIGGALAGLAGMIHFSGVEYKLRPGFGNQLGYTSFLACWLARHKPFPILVAAFVFATLSVAGDSLQLNSGVPSATIYILTALILVAVLGWTTQRKVSA